MSKKIYNLTVEPITAVHIGTGEELTPLDYKVCTELKDNKFNRDVYLRFFWEKVIEKCNLNSDLLNKFYQISNNNNMSELRAFFQENVNEFSQIAYLCETTKEFAGTYKENMEKDPMQNAAIVHEMFRKKGAKGCVIPGSSLKGAIRTAVLNGEANKYDKTDNINKDNYAAKLFNMDKGKYNAEADPLRCLAVSDCEVPDKENSQLVGSLKIIGTDSIPKNGDTQIHAEVLCGKYTGMPGIGSGRIIIDEDLFHANNANDRINNFFSIENIISACNDFFWKQFDKEISTFYEYESEETKMLTELEKELDEIARCKNSFIIRVGRWSQVEFITIDKFKKPKVPPRHDYGTTRTVFNYDGQYLPMGWCKCTVTEI